MLTTVNRSEKPGQAQTPAIGFCSEKHRLADEILQAIHEISAILSEQVQAVIAGDTDFTRFDVLLHFAHKKKEQAKYAWIEHVEGHGCGDGNSWR